MKRFTNCLLVTAAASALTAGSAGAATLLHNWTFDGNTNDSAGAANGTFGDTDASGENYVAGQVGQALTFDGVDDFVSTAAGTIVPATDYTLSAWVFWEAGNNSRGTIAGGQVSGTRGDVFALSRDAAGGDTKLFLNLLVNGGQGGSIVESPDGTVAKNAWQHVAYTVDSVNGSTVYLNGAAVGSTPTRTTHDPAENFVIGRRPDGESFYFDGLIDDVAIFDGVLSLNDLATVRDSGAAAIPEPSSLALLGLGGLLIARRRRSA